MSKRMEMTYEELMSVHRQESKQTSLVKVSSDFYPRTASYLDALNQRICGKGSDTSDVSGMLHNQLKTAKEKSAEIYEARMRKIALMAMTAAFGSEPRLDNATPEETGAFNTLKAFFLEHCKKTMSVECGAVESPKEVSQAPPKDVQPAPVQEKPDAEPPKEQLKSEIILVRILEDLPAFAGTDKNYRLAKEDVISLPRNIADILLKHNKAIEVRQSS